MSGAAFPDDVLGRLREAVEVEIETSRGPQAPIHRTIIWIVVDDRDRVLVRSVRGERGRWWRELVVHPAGGVWIGDERVAVGAERAQDPERIAACSSALEAKYADDGALGSMLRESVLDTTLELTPA